MSWPLIGTIAGGVALILFGVRTLRRGLDRLFGARLGIWIETLAHNKIKAFFTGVGVSMAASSSTTLSALAVQTIDRGHLSAKEMLAVMFGVNIGMTILAVLGSLDVTHLAPELLAVGVIFYQFTKANRTRGIGQTLLALGFIFSGINLIHNAVSTIQPDSSAGNLITSLENYSLIFTLLAAAIAIALQSSTATILMLVSISGTSSGSGGGLLHMQPAIAAVAGVNLGIATTTLIIGWKNLEARRLAVGNLLVKVAVAILILILLAPIAALIKSLPGSFGVRIALSHTAFNVIVAIIGLPAIGVISIFLNKWITDKDIYDPLAPHYLTDPPPESATLALGQSRREILRISEVARAMLDDLWHSLETQDETLAKKVSTQDDVIDALDKSIKKYLTKLATEGIDGDDATEQLRQLRYLAELESIGDLLDKNLSELAVKYARGMLHFSDEGWQELRSYYEKVRENMLIAETAFNTRDLSLAKQLLDHKEKINDLHRSLRDKHLARLNAGLTESHETSAIHLDILTHLKRINSCVSHIAYALLGDDQSQPNKQLDTKTNSTGLKAQHIT